METKRIEYMDTLRGLAIFLMVMGHVLAWIFTDYQKAFDTNIYSGLLWKFIYAFHMPLFMFVSGYFFRVNLNGNLFKEFCKFIYKKFVALLIPFTTVGYLWWIVKDSGGVGYWFLRTLFELFVVCFPIYILSDKIAKLCCVKSKQSGEVKFLLLDLFLFGLGYLLLKILFHFLNEELQTVFDTWKIIQYYPYFVFGLLLRKHELIQRILNKNIIYSISLFTFFILFILRTFGYLTVAGFIVGNTISFSAIIFLHYFFIKCADNSSKAFKFFSYLGVHSIEIYLIHFFFTFRFTELGEYLIEVKFYGTSLLIQIVYSIIVSVIITALSLGVAKMINCSRSLSFFLLGKKQNFSELFDLK
jgi:fucose 4-O-acetylase-like acetyltransferase